MNERHWGASAIRSGTNERMEVRGATQEEVDLQLFGTAYGARRDSVVYYRFDPAKQPPDYYQQPSKKGK